MTVQNETSIETAEAAYRRIARRKLEERGYPPDQIESRIMELLQQGLPIDPKRLTD